MTMALFGMGMAEMAVIVGILCLMALPAIIALAVVFFILRRQRP
jgi:hypothetical protein